MVGVLVFVDHDVPEPLAVVLRDLREVLQHRDGLADEVVEVQRVGRTQPPLVLAEDGGDGAGQLVGARLQRRDGDLGGDELVLRLEIAFASRRGE